MKLIASSCLTSTAPDKGMGEISFAEAGQFYFDDVENALRNHGMPLESLRDFLTPIGSHFLLCHFDIPALDESRWELEISGLVTKPLSLSLAEIRRYPSVSISVTMECAGNGRVFVNPRPLTQPWNYSAVSTAQWTGVPLKHLLAEAGASDDAVDLVFSGRDRGIEAGKETAFQRSLSLADAQDDGVILAYEMNGQALPPQHGFPLRLIVPGWYGMTNVKWLCGIELIGERFHGHYMDKTYRIMQAADDPGEPLRSQRVRALMAPPGVHHDVTGLRTVAPGPVLLVGKAWAGARAVQSVHLSFDEGKTWRPASLDARVEPYAWRSWSLHWNALTGRHIIWVRATDDHGISQPIAPSWNYRAMANNAVQKTIVDVRTLENERKLSTGGKESHIE